MTLNTDATESGVVKSVTARGYGFIRRSNSPDGTRRPDLFVHAAECNNAFDEFKPGTKVVFRVGEDSHGREEAKNVIVSL